MRICKSESGRERVCVGVRERVSESVCEGVRERRKTKFDHFFSLTELDFHCRGHSLVFVKGSSN